MKFEQSIKASLAESPSSKNEQEISKEEFNNRLSDLLQYCEKEIDKLYSREAFVLQDFDGKRKNLIKEINSLLEMNRKFSDISAEEKLKNRLKQLDFAQEEAREPYRQETIEWVIKTIKSWHDEVNPDYVFVTVSGAVPYGILFKEAYKMAYPGENQPSFFTFDPKASTFDIHRTPHDVLDSKEELKKFFKTRVTKDNPKIIVYDEGATPRIDYRLKNKGDSEDEEQDSSRYPDWPKDKPFIPAVGDVPFHKHELGYAFRQIKRGLETIGKDTSEIYANRNAYYGMEVATKYPFGKDAQPMSKFFGLKGGFESGRSKTLDESLITRELLDQLEGKGIFTFAGRVVHHPEQRKLALEWVKELRKLGKEAGEKLREKIKNSPK